MPSPPSGPYRPNLTRLPRGPRADGSLRIACLEAWESGWVAGSAHPNNQRKSREYRGFFSSHSSMPGRPAARMSHPPRWTSARALLLELLDQLLAAVRWQFLEALEGVVQLLALLGRQLLKAAHVFARLITLLRTHLLPLRDAIAYFLTLVGRQLIPVLRPLQQALLALRLERIPLRGHRRQHVTLGRRQAVPRTRSRLRLARRRCGLSPQWCRCACEQRDQAQRQGETTQWHA